MVFTNSLSSYYEKFLATGEVKCIDEEIPFELPATWEWERWGYIFSHCTGKPLNGIIEMEIYIHILLHRISIGIDLNYLP